MLLSLLSWLAEERHIIIFMSPSLTCFKEIIGWGKRRSFYIMASLDTVQLARYYAASSLNKAVDNNYGLLLCFYHCVSHNVLFLLVFSLNQ